MKNRQMIAFVSLLFWIAAPSLFGQEFLKQLEEKLLKKQQTNKEPSKPENAAASNEDEKIPPPAADPLVLGPRESEESLPSPSPAKKPSAPVQPPRASEPAPPQPKRPVGPVENPGYLGMTVESAVGGGFGLKVVSVTNNSPAWKAGFRPSDRVIGVNGNAVSSVDDFARLLAQYPAGSAVKFLVDRRGESKSLTAILIDRELATRVLGEAAVPSNGTPIPSGNSQAYLGVNVSNLSPAFRSQFSIPTFRGASVTEVIENSPADRAGLRPGDCIVSFKGQEVRNAEDVLNGILESKPGETVFFTYYRGQAPKQGMATLTRADGLELPTLSTDITQEMLTPEYVAGLHAELDRISEELRASQDRILELESSIRRLERQR